MRHNLDAEFFRVRALRHFILEHTQVLGEHLA